MALLIVNKYFTNAFSVSYKSFIRMSVGTPFDFLDP